MTINLKNNLLALNVEMLTLYIYFVFRSISLLKIASTNIAVKKRLNDGINTGYQSF